MDPKIDPTKLAYTTATCIRCSRTHVVVVAKALANVPVQEWVCGTCRQIEERGKRDPQIDRAFNDLEQGRNPRTWP